jgi:hypothetical protein
MLIVFYFTKNIVKSEKEKKYTLLKYRVSILYKKFLRYSFVKFIHKEINKTQDLVEKTIVIATLTKSPSGYTSKRIYMLCIWKGIDKSSSVLLIIL